jgi:steroid delta-isomerase-like uncharacterized protein
MSESNKALCRRFFEQVWNNRNLAAIDELFAPNYVRHTVSGPEFGTGPQSMHRMVNFYLGSFPDVRFTIDDVVAEQDKVVLRWTARATHQGQFEGIQPTGKAVNVSGTTLVRIAGGKIVEAWDSFDALGLLQQLGAFPNRAVGA